MCKYELQNMSACTYKQQLESNVFYENQQQVKFTDNILYVNAKTNHSVIFLDESFSLSRKN
jgi:hypothetical protein